MEHALTLARKAVGLASPNPHVGCAIVRDGQIVGEGFHQYEWRDHAEIVALKSAGDKARGATLYVNLEPCNHTGRTGPCTEQSLPQAFNASSRPWMIRIPSIPAVALSACARRASKFLRAFAKKRRAASMSRSRAGCARRSPL